MQPGTPPAEVELDEPLIRGLLERQHPGLAEETITMAEAGWDNVMVRLGEEWALRLPRRAVAESLLLNEQRWLPVLGPRLPLAIPVPVGLGVPDDTFPFHWSVLRWLPGEAADLSPPSEDDAMPLAEFLQALHQEAPADAPRNPSRDRSLAERSSDTIRRMDELSSLGEPVPNEIREIWSEAVEEELPEVRSWIAGDMHARNVLVHEGRLSAVIDWGDLCAGDPATDLASYWMLFDSGTARRRGLDAYGADTGLELRARGWAVFFGVLLLHTGLQDTPRHAAMGRDTLRRVLS